MVALSLAAHITDHATRSVDLETLTCPGGHVRQQAAVQLDQLLAVRARTT
ncbi:MULTISPECIES: hypothetical protein [unclassified Streptomyces]